MITSVMYHYVRPVEESNLRYLSLNDFEKQLDWLEKSIGKFVTQEDWEQSKAGHKTDGVLLTFDDGLKDHIEYVLPILQSRKIFALFFVSTGPLSSETMLAVHLTHKLLSIGKSSEILDFFHLQLPDSIWRKLHRGAAASAYTKHRDLDVNVSIKKVVNYLFTDFNLQETLEATADKFLSNSLKQLAQSWYLSELDIKNIAKAGMKIGSHSCTHKLLSLLHSEEVYSELAQSKNILEEVLGVAVDEFCYPYGGIHSYNETVKNHLRTLGYSFAHDVEPRAISQADFINRYSLPRFNCNEFPFGIAHSLKNTPTNS